ncbi:hypothetical protein HHI36_006450 [Cryptolaemus montrouzieri]|uniref:Uncharacterized protein n=1 Tax=Cryptolaemus montrouzieri TaxID=559131 RepID=A0ABD2NY65_9CUCU
MDKVKNIQLHEIIKNSLATYLSYKWSQDKLFLKKRKKKVRGDEGGRKKKTRTLERQHSIINLENDVFIYDAKNRTFTQLDLCDCFKNGFKYRKIDPFDIKPKEKKEYELCELSRESPENIQKYHSYQCIDVENSVENLFSNQLSKRDQWRKNMNTTLCPSKFDLFIQKELNKCTGRNFNVKSFKINTKQESETPSKNKVCSSAAIGYYTITTYDNALQCEKPNATKGKILNTKQCNFMDIPPEPYSPKKMYSKGLQCKRSSHYHHPPSKKEKIISTREAGIQCYFTPLPHAEERIKFGPLNSKITEVQVLQNRRAPSPRQKFNFQKKPLRKKHSSLSDLFTPAENKNVNTIQINSSAELRKILKENHSASSVNLLNSGEYFRTFFRPRHLMAYYQTSSTSKDNKGDTNDEDCTKRDPIVVAASTHISPKCSVLYKECTDRREMAQKKSKEKVQTDGREKSQKNVIDPKHKSGCAPNCNKPCSKVARSLPRRCCSSCACICQKVDEKRKPEATTIYKPPPPPPPCCDCSDTTTEMCICDILHNLRERMKKQTEEQNRNLEQVLEELTKQDKELEQIRQYVDKYKNKPYKSKKRKPAVCSCYAATVQYDFTTDLAPLPDLNEKEIEDADSKERKRSAEPEIIEIFGSNKKFDLKKRRSVSKLNSWKTLWGKNSEVKAFFVNDLFKKRNNMQKKCSSSSSSAAEETELKKNKKAYKQWFSSLFGSKKDLKKNNS